MNVRWFTSHLGSQRVKDGSLGSLLRLVRLVHFLSQFDGTTSRMLTFAMFLGCVIKRACMGCYIEGIEVMVYVLANGMVSFGL